MGICLPFHIISVIGLIDVMSNYGFHVSTEESEVFNSCLEPDTMESEDEGEGHNNRKRKAQFEEGGSRKRLCSSGDHDSVWDTKDGEAQLTAPEFTAVTLGEEYPGPFLNVSIGCESQFE